MSIDHEQERLRMAELQKAVDQKTIDLKAGAAALPLGLARSSWEFDEPALASTFNDRARVERTNRIDQARRHERVVNELDEFISLLTRYPEIDRLLTLGKKLGYF